MVCRVEETAVSPPVLTGRSLAYILRGTIVNKTYGIHKNLPGIYLTIFLTIFGSISYGPP